MIGKLQGDPDEDELLPTKMLLLPLLLLHTGGITGGGIRDEDAS